MQEYNKKEAKGLFSRIGFTYVIGSIMVLGIQEIIILLLKNIKPEWYEDKNIGMLFTMLPVYFIIYPVFLALINLIPKSAPIEKHKMSVGQFLVALIMCYSLIYTGNIASSILISFLSKINGLAPTNVVMGMLGGTNVWIQLFILVIFPPIFEELIFRKFLIDRTIKYGEFVSILLSATLFCLFHGNFSQGIYAFLLGGFLAYIYIRTGKIGYTISFHMIINFIGSIVAGRLLDLIKYSELVEKLSSGDTEAYLLFVQENIVGYMIYFAYVIFLFVVVIVGIILFIVLRKRFFLKSNEMDIPKGERFKTLFINPGIIVFFLFWIGMYIFSLFG